MTRERLVAALEADPAEKRRILLSVWEDGSAVDRCAAAHHLADLQESPRDEVTWDIRALEAARSADPAEVRGFFPSLHLNLGDVYRRLGDLPRAREHLEAAQADLDTLDDDGYGQMIRGGVARLAERLG